VVDQLFNDLTEDCWLADDFSYEGLYIPIECFQSILVLTDGHEEISDSGIIEEHFRNLAKLWEGGQKAKLGRSLKKNGQVFISEEDAKDFLLFIKRMSNDHLGLRISKKSSYTGPTIDRLLLKEEFIEEEPLLSEPEIEEALIEILREQDTVGLSLRSITRTLLLTAEEEVEIAKKIRKGREAEEVIASGRELDEETKQAKEAVIQEALEARNWLIEANTRLVISIAKRYMGRGLDFLDLIQEGILGTIKAAEKYDETRGYKFSTYATWWIRQRITRAIADQGRIIRLPVYMNDKIRKLFGVREQLIQELGRVPTVEELAEKLELDPKKVTWLMRIGWRPLSLQLPVGDDDDGELGDFIENEDAPSPFDLASENELQNKMAELLKTLDPREAKIIRLHFGFEGKQYTLEEVGKEMGLTRERIRQIEAKALRRLRHPHRSRHLRTYLD
jgi:RNA polymerase primary sigma factor